MINVQNKPKDETSNTFFAPNITKRQIQLKKYNRSFISNQKQESFELRENKSCPQMQKQLSPPYSHFKNKLLSYLQESQKHDRKERDNIEEQNIKFCTWFNNKKQSNNLCKNQTPHRTKKPNFLRKNIKRYISEVTQAKRKKNSNKNTSHLKTEQTDNSLLNQTANPSKNSKKDISIVVSKETRTIQQLVPIHHTRAYFYEREPLRKSYNAFIDSPLSQELSKQRPISFSQYTSIEGLQSKPQSPLQIYVDSDDQLQQFEGKFQQHQKFLNIKGHITKLHSKKKTFIRGSKKKQNDEQVNEISPWKRRRNTVDSQPPTD